MRNGGLVAILSALLCTVTSCRPLGYYVKKIEFGNKLHVLPIAPLLSVEPTSGRFYSVSHTGTGLTEIAELEWKPGMGRPLPILLLETNHDQNLDRMVKRFEIMKGPFGTICVEKTCFYNRPVDNNGSAVAVRSFSNSYPEELPLQLSGPPEALPPLTSVSLVRIFGTNPAYTVVSASYEADGGLGSLRIDETKGGDWISGYTSVGLNTAIGLQLTIAAREKYGIPIRIDIPGYLHSRRLSLPVVTLPEDLLLLNQGYGHNAILRIDRLQNGALQSSRFVRAPARKEEQDLDLLCEAQFQRQRALGQSTVE